MAFPGTLLSLSHAAATNFLNLWYGGTTAHSTGDNIIIDDLKEVERKVGLGGASNQDPAAANMVGRVPVARLDGTTEWLSLYQFNSLINGGMEDWPNGTSIVVPASVATTGGYSTTRWCLKTNANQASHVTQVAGLTDGSQWAARV